METLQLLHFTARRTVAINTIEYLEAVGNYTNVHLKGQKPMLVAITLKRFEERLPAFLRIHKGMLVNPEHIVTYQLFRRPICRTFPGPAVSHLAPTHKRSSVNPGPVRDWCRLVISS